MQRRFNRPQHPRMAMAQDERPPRADVIEIPIAVDVEEIRPFAALDERRLPADGAERARRAVDAAGDEPAGTLKGFLAANTRRFHGCFSSASALRVLIIRPA